MRGLRRQTYRKEWKRKVRKMRDGKCKRTHFRIQTLFGRLSVPQKKKVEGDELVMW